MTRSKFTLFNVIGAILWVVGVVTIGYFFGNIPLVKANMDKVIWALIFVPGLFVLLGTWRARRKAARQAVVEMEQG